MKILQTLGMYQGCWIISLRKGSDWRFCSVRPCVFYAFSALKLIANTVTELSLLFFTNDPEGDNLKKSD